MEVIAQASDPGTFATQAGVFAIVLVVAFWLLKRSDDRERRAAASAHEEIVALRAEMAKVHHELNECHRERARDRARISALETKIELRGDRG